MMTENEYILACNLTRIRAAEDILSDVSVGSAHHIDELEYLSVMNTIGKWRNKLFETLKTEEGTNESV